MIGVIYTLWAEWYISNIIDLSHLSYSYNKDSCREISVILPGARLKFSTYRLYDQTVRAYYWESCRIIITDDTLTYYEGDLKELVRVVRLLKRGYSP